MAQTHRITAHIAAQHTTQHWQYSTTVLFDILHYNYVLYKSNLMLKPYNVCI